MAEEEEIRGDRLWLTVTMKKKRDKGHEKRGESQVLCFESRVMRERERERER
ncbi:hypothetical protein YC2023_052517 [Brassica napus]